VIQLRVAFVESGIVWGTRGKEKPADGSCYPVKTNFIKNTVIPS
jgi:hypothetical protein